MATNLYVNYLGQADLTLNGAIVAGDTSVNVTIPTVLATFGIVNPSGVGIYKVLIESEIVHFTAGTVTAGIRTWTLARGQEGTTAASHADGTILKLEATADALANAVQLSPTAQQTGTINVSAGITSGGLLTGTDVNAPHAARHMGDGTDPLDKLVQIAVSPALYGYTAWTYDILLGAQQGIPAAGVVCLTKIMTPYAFTVNNVDLDVRTAGTGVTALANCFVGIYDSGGTRRFTSADQSSAWASTGLKSVAVSGGYVVTAGSYIYIAVLVGTQSTTNVQLMGISSATSVQMLANLTAAQYRAATQLTGQTSLPTPSLTLSSNAAANIAFWAGVR